MHRIQYAFLAVLLLVGNDALCGSDASPITLPIAVGDSAEPIAIYREAQNLSADEIAARLEQADLVAVLSITHINSLVNPGLSMPGMLAVQGYEYHGQLEQRLKATPVKALTVRVDLSDCRERLLKGESYLVVSRLNVDSQLQSFRCDDLIHRSQASERIAQFNRLSKLQVAIN